MGAHSAALHSCVGMWQWPEQQTALITVVLPCTGWSPAGCPAASGPTAGLPATACTSRLHQHPVAVSLQQTRHTAVVDGGTKKNHTYMRHLVILSSLQNWWKPTTLKPDSLAN